MNSDFTSKDTSLWSSGICIVLMASIKFSVDCSLCLDSSVRGSSTLVKYLDSWQVGNPQKETMVRIGMLGLCSFGSSYGLVGWLRNTTIQYVVGLIAVPVFFGVSSLLLSLRCSAGVGSHLSTS